jgi:hypothetical protein
MGVGYHFFEVLFGHSLQTYVRVAYDGQPTLMRGLNQEI